MIEAFKDTWTSQLFVLGDYYNVQQADPTFAADYTANKAKYATTPAALNGFQKMQEIKARATTTTTPARPRSGQGMKLLAAGKAAPVPDAVGSPVGLLPADQAKPTSASSASPATTRAKAGATVWEPGGASTSRSRARTSTLAKKFVAFIASPAGHGRLRTRPSRRPGPYLVNGSTLPANAPQAAKDLQAYIDAQGDLPGAGVPVPGEGPVPGADHHRGRRPARPRQRAPPSSTTRTSPRRPSSWACPDGDRVPGRARLGRSGPAATRGPAGPPRRRRRDPARPRRDTSRRTYSLLFYLPAGVIYGVFFIVPTVVAFYFSLTRWTLFDSHFIGLDNFRQFFSEQSLRIGLRQHPDLRGDHQRPESRARACCSRCC